MSKPLNHRLVHGALLVIEFVLLWLLLTALVQPQVAVSTFTLVGAIALFFVFTAHLMAIALQTIVPRFSTERHSFAILLSILSAILLAVVLSSGIIILMSALSGGF